MGVRGGRCAGRRGGLHHAAVEARSAQQAGGRAQGLQGHQGPPGCDPSVIAGWGPGPPVIGPSRTA
eukprot:213137-Prorocentrum_minimum.AAC.1